MTRPNLVSAVLTLLLLTGCHYSNPHGSQAGPPVTRLHTEPPGATVYIPKLNLELETPCDLPHEVKEGDDIVISKEGYLRFKGVLSDLRQTATGTYHLKLIR